MGEVGNKGKGQTKHGDNSARCHRELKKAGSDKKKEVSQWSNNEATKPK
jgi:hypothetical protein